MHESIVTTIDPADDTVRVNRVGKDKGGAKKRRSWSGEMTSMHRMTKWHSCKSICMQYRLAKQNESRHIDRLAQAGAP